MACRDRDRIVLRGAAEMSSAEVEVRPFLIGGPRQEHELYRLFFELLFAVSRGAQFSRGIGLRDAGAAEGKAGQDGEPEHSATTGDDRVAAAEPRVGFHLSVGIFGQSEIDRTGQAAAAEHQPGGDRLNQALRLPGCVTAD